MSKFNNRDLVVCTDATGHPRQLKVNKTYEVLETCDVGVTILDDTGNRVYFKDERFVLKGGEIKTPSSGVKHDDNKVRMDLLPLNVLWAIAQVLSFGAKKYGPNNWQNLEGGYERYKGALLRHLTQAEDEYTDEESGLPHVAHMCCCAVFMLYFTLKGKK